MEKADNAEKSHNPPAVIILAAGASTRLGRPKQLLPFRGRSLLCHAADTALASHCRPVVVVLGSQADLLAKEIDGMPLALVVNEAWPEGMASSIRAGLNFLVKEPSHVESAILMLCDQPFVSTQFLNQLASRREIARKSIIAAEYGGSVGVPALFGRHLFPELMALKGTQGAKPIIVKYANETERIPLPEGTIDIDNEGDVKQLGCF